MLDETDVTSPLKHDFGLGDEVQVPIELQSAGIHHNSTSENVKQLQKLRSVSRFLEAVITVILFALLLEVSESLRY